MRAAPGAGGAAATPKHRGESRWPPLVAVLGALVMYLTLPDRLVVSPRWVLPVLEIALIVPLVIANPTRLTRDSSVLRALSISMILLIGLTNMAALGLLVDRLLARADAATGRQLIVSAVEVWLTNVVVFGLAFWELDSGGPVARTMRPESRRRPPEFLFPQMAAPGVAAPDWAPRFADYLYLGFTNATAFSPTDTLPLTARVKLLMMVQSLVSIVTVGLVVARAVNILQ